MRTLHFGGSFNPIHHGHLLGSRSMAEQAGFDQVVLVPSHHSPHKSSAAAPASDRLAMCKAAIASEPLFTVDPIELSRPGPSYTIDTVRELKRKSPGTEIHWLIGADMASFLPHWHQAVPLLNEVQFVLMARPGWFFDWNSLPPEFHHLQSAVVQTPLIDISSTDIRNRLAANRSISYLTPPAVVDYIRSHQIYTTGTNAAP